MVPSFTSRLQLEGDPQGAAVVWLRGEDAPSPGSDLIDLARPFDRWRPLHFANQGGNR
jgi:hypothetical protein